MTSAAHDVDGDTGGWECDRHPGKTAWASEMLARNAVTLHALRHPHCAGVQAYPCRGAVDGHWHTGHPSRQAGVACQAGAGPRPLRAAIGSWRRPAPPA